MCKVPAVSKEPILATWIKLRDYFVCKSIALKMIISHLSTNVVEDFFTNWLTNNYKRTSFAELVVHDNFHYNM